MMFLVFVIILLNADSGVAAPKPPSRVQPRSSGQRDTCFSHACTPSLGSQEDPKGGRIPLPPEKPVQGNNFQEFTWMLFIKYFTRMSSEASPEWRRMYLELPPEERLLYLRKLYQQWLRDKYSGENIPRYRLRMFPNSADCPGPGCPSERYFRW